MRDSPSKGQAVPVEDAAHPPETRYGVERERLIDDLAFLVVRQHQSDQRAASENNPTSAPTEVAAK